jgi:multidrug efflux pump subunit AcrB
MSTTRVERDLRGEAAPYDPNEKFIVDLARDYRYNGIVYGPGENIEVPRGLADQLSLAHKEGAKAHVPSETGAQAEQRLREAQLEVARRLTGMPQSTSQLGQKGQTGGTPANATVGGKSTDELEEMTKDELAELAAKQNVEVSRSGGGEGEPLKSDYVKALAKPK